jgi:hypothetical protein
MRIFAITLVNGAAIRKKIFPNTKNSFPGHGQRLQNIRPYIPEKFQGPVESLTLARSALQQTRHGTARTKWFILASVKAEAVFGKSPMTSR